MLLDTLQKHKSRAYYLDFSPSMNETPKILSPSFHFGGICKYPVNDQLVDQDCCNQDRSHFAPNHFLLTPSNSPLVTNHSHVEPNHSPIQP